MLMLMLLSVISGLRFGLLQIKVGLVSLLSKFKLSVCEKTELPIKFDPKALITACTSGIWLRINRRSDS
jgi:cytochrome P450 family 6